MQLQFHARSQTLPVQVTQQVMVVRTSVQVLPVQVMPHNPQRLQAKAATPWAFATLLESVLQPAIDCTPRPRLGTGHSIVRSAHLALV